DLQQLQHFNLGYLENILEGKYRPGHFQGVCNVVYRLLNVVKPDTIFLGSKDYQQYLVLKTMMQQFFPDININLVDILREENGLAMSSRNTRLNNDARKKATAIYHALQYIKQNIEENSFEDLTQHAKEIILNNGFDKIDYIEICDAETLLPADNFNADKKLIVLTAAFINNVRLIDNIVL
ncbi:MAG TPA: pantoate--beta-alanine ligase, partial [Parafilimonas sp.]